MSRIIERSTYTTHLVHDQHSRPFEESPSHTKELLLSGRKVFACFGYWGVQISEDIGIDVRVFAVCGLALGRDEMYTAEGIELSQIR